MRRLTLTAFSVPHDRVRLEDFVPWQGTWVWSVANFTICGLPAPGTALGGDAGIVVVVVVAFSFDDDTVDDPPPHAASEVMATRASAATPTCTRWRRDQTGMTSSLGSLDRPVNNV